MKILTIRTDREESEVGLFEDHKQLSYIKWHAHRDLSKTILNTIEYVLKQAKIGKNDISGIVFYKGPGSFTGLRISAAVVITLAYSIPAKLISLNGKEWVDNGIRKIIEGRNDKTLQIDYGREANITKPQ